MDELPSQQELGEKQLLLAARVGVRIDDALINTGRKMQEEKNLAATVFGAIHIAILLHIKKDQMPDHLKNTLMQTLDEKMLFAADQGDPVACYYVGSDVLYDPDEELFLNGIQLMKHAAENGLTIAQDDILICGKALYGLLSLPQNQINKERAIYAFSTYVEVSGDTSPFSEAFSEELETLAHEWSEQGNLAGALGCRLFNAKLNNRVAISNLGWHYELGKGVAVDLDLARNYYERAIEMGDEWSKGRIAGMDGTTVAPSKSKFDSVVDSMSGLVDKAVAFSETETGQKVMKVGKVVGKIGLGIIKAKHEKKKRAAYEDDIYTGTYDDDFDDEY